MQCVLRAELRSLFGDLLCYPGDEFSAESTRPGQPGCARPKLRMACPRLDFPIAGDPSDYAAVTAFRGRSSDGAERHSGRKDRADFARRQIYPPVSHRPGQPPLTRS